MIKNIPIGLISGEISDILTSDIIEKMNAIKPDLQNTIVPNVGHAPILNETTALAFIKKILND